MKLRNKPNKEKEPENGLLSEEKREKLRETRRYALLTVLNTVVIYGLYVILLNAIPRYTVVIVSVYLVALLAISVCYVCYNRGFSRKNLTVEMLPSTWSEDEKTRFLEDGVERLKKSKWCLTVIIPFVFTFFMDLFYFYIYLEHLAPIFGDLF